MPRVIPLRETLARLVAVDSVSARSNLPVLDILEPQLEGLGFSVERQVYAPGKANLVARRGTPGPGGLALVGHTDTVPYDPAWREALTLVEKASKLYGRGACDTKGFIACALGAAARAPASLAQPLVLVFTGDEEVGCQGAKDLARRGEVRPRFAIVGEPTELRPVRAGKGYCLAEVTIRGEEGHSAYPDRGASALRGARLFLEALEALEAQLREEQSVGFSPPFTTLNVGVFRAGKAKNIIPGEAVFTVEWRPLPSQPAARVPEALATIAASVQRRLPRLSVVVDVQRGDLGFETAVGSALLAFLEERSGSSSTSIPFGTEAPQLVELGAETVVFGPGDIRVAHQSHEFVPEDHLARCEAILLAAIERFCG